LLGWACWGRLAGAGLGVLPAQPVPELLRLARAMAAERYSAGQRLAVSTAHSVGQLCPSLAATPQSVANERLPVFEFDLQAWRQR
jgi:hypothetical protein